MRHFDNITLQTDPRDIRSSHCGLYPEVGDPETVTLLINKCNCSKYMQYTKEPGMAPTSYASVARPISAVPNRWQRELKSLEQLKLKRSPISRLSAS